MIDFHAHILPSVDHGSSGLETSVSQLALADKYGVKTIVCTSHFYPYRESVMEFVTRRGKGFDVLCENNNTNVNLIKGAEVMLTMDLADIEEIEQLCIQNTKYMLVEMPDMINSTWIYDVLLRLRDRGISPIIAHLDRYPKSVQENLLDMDLKIQVNAAAFSNFKKRREMTSLVHTGLVHVLGSDIHGANAHAYKDFLKAKSKLGEYFDKMQKNAEKILKI